MVRRVAVLALELLDDHVGGAVPHFAAGDVPVLNGHDGVVRMAAQVVDHHLAAGAELGRDARGDLPQQVQLAAFQGVSLLCSFSGRNGPEFVELPQPDGPILLYHSILSGEINDFTQNIFLVFRFFV